MAGYKNVSHCDKLHYHIYQTGEILFTRDDIKLTSSRW